MSIYAIMSRATSVYHGPGSNIYAVVGSVGLYETVQVIAKELDWFYIEYETSTNNKRGYVPYDSITNAAEVADNIPARSLAGWADVPIQNITVYMGPNTSYAISGSIYSGEGLTVFNETAGDYTYIEYSTSAGTKRGYILTTQIANRNRGVLANVSISSASVYAGPNTSYFQSGAVFNSEYVVILERDFSPEGYYFIEYNSTSGRKRGYISQNYVSTNSTLNSIPELNTKQFVKIAIRDLTVYSGPNTNFATIGSIFTNEIVDVLEGVSVESSYTYIEYNTTSGKKRGYVITSGLQSTSISLAVMLRATNVYHGPDSSNYSLVGSVNSEEFVHVIAMERNWFYIEYETSTNNKRGYVPYDSIANAIEIEGNVRTRFFTGHADVPLQSTTVYMGPSTSYAISGSVFSGEGITKFNETAGDYTYIEYSTSTGTKRGYMLTTQIANRNRGVLANVSVSSASVYAGPDTSYFRSGGVFNGEYVVILERDITSFYSSKWYYIEYNSTSGRKRGYVIQDNIVPHSSLITVESLKAGIRLALAQQDLSVYSGPNSNFAVIGSIFSNERVSVFESDPNESLYSYIEYNTSSGSKRGYVMSSALQSAPIALPVISAENITKGQYGVSGNNRPLEYYKIGNGENVLAAVFGVHGYEDAWAGDGEELAKIAKYFIEQLAQDNFSAWTIYCIPMANPDGLLDGWTNNGPGRTTISTANDINRSFPANFSAYYDSRNFTGSSSLGSPEASALSEILLQWKPSEATMILLDVHGWLNQTIGDYNVGKYYCNEFGLTNNSLENSRGYLTRWGQLNEMLASLIELPFPTSPQDIITRDFAGKFVRATHNLLNNILNAPTIIPVTGVNILPTSVSLTHGETIQLTATVLPSDATNKEVIWLSSDLSIATVDENGLVTAGQNDGNTIITVTTVDGNFSATSNVNVTTTSAFLKYPIDLDGNWTMTLAWNGESSNGNYGHMANDMTSTHKNVKAITTGFVENVGYNNANGNVVIIKHTINSKTYYSFYAHLESFTVTKGQEVQAGYQIGVMGGTPNFSPHLHLGIFVGTPMLGMYGYYRDEDGNKAYFDDNGNGYIDYEGIRFYDPQKVFITDGNIISNNYPI